MEESQGQQYALQIALQTMKERCLQLQQRLSIVEDENMNLRVKYYVESMELAQETNKSDVDSLREKVAHLTKQKSQLTHNVLMVASENKQLWGRLSKLTLADQGAGDTSSKVVETEKQSSAVQSPSTLIRSKTFTHEAPTKLVRKTENETYVDSSLEDISLKIINSIAQEKYELEKQCAQMMELQSSESFLSSSIGFAYPQDETEDCTIAEIAHNMEKLIHVKDALICQKQKLKKGFELLKTLTESGVMCRRCKVIQDKELESQKLNKQRLEISIKLPSTSKETNTVEKEKICPMCNKIFYKELLGDFITHVENHFIGDDELILDNFEVIATANRK